jgi:hypothetical protein
MANVTYQKPKDTKHTSAITETEFKVSEGKVLKPVFTVTERILLSFKLLLKFNFVKVFFDLVILTMAISAETCSIIYEIIIFIDL